MKKIIVCTLLLIISATSFSQKTTPKSPAVKTDYREKSKHQRNAANAMLYGGASIGLIGGIIQVSETSTSFNNGGKKRSIVSQILLWMGLASVAGSVPLFIAYHRNKNKGMGLSFKNETAPQIQNGGFVNLPVPSLTLKINL